MTTILIKILVESFAFYRRKEKKRKKREMTIAGVKNKTIAECIKLNNLKFFQFYVGNLRITTLCCARGLGVEEAECAIAGSTF
jgi:hypothetical protein